MGAFVAVASTRQAPPGRSVAVMLDGLSIAIFNLGDEIVAVENKCPHQGAPLAGSPILGRTRVRCALHGWVFDLKGDEENDGLARYPTRVLDDGTIEVSATKIAFENLEFRE
jgi:nitrite reductase/ring-hydroxylating ferredoxin subunit